MSIFSALMGGGQKASPAPLPAAPTASDANQGANTSAATAAAAAAGPGRAANIVAGNDLSLESPDDGYSVKKKLLGA